MFFRRVDRKGLGRITYKQFSDAILPQSSEYANRVADRLEYYGKRGADLRWYFSSETRHELKELWRVIFYCERSAEQLK